MKAKAGRSVAVPRRKPRQSRARHTSQALQEAFVRLLVERGYAGITIREIVAVAGTGLGSFYEYFASKEDLARVCLHLRSKALLMALHDAVERHTGRPLREMYDRFVDEWLGALDAAADVPPTCAKEEAARVGFTIMYGLFAHAHIGVRDKPDLQALSRQARSAINAYLESLCHASPPTRGPQ